jgi:phosphoglucosamine mutase
MSRELFGTDGVRGIAGEYPLNNDGCEQIGMAVGKLFAEPGQSVLIGCDTRESSPQLVAALTVGLNAVGVNVVSAGIITTPGLAYLTARPEFVAGIMVTASHNPYQFNGVKVFDKDGDKLSDEVESTLNVLIESPIEPISSNTTSTDDRSLTESYIKFLTSTTEARPFSGLRIAVDCANGSASKIAPEVFTRLGAEVTTLFDEATYGQSINAGCGATDTTVLQRKVIDEGFDLGIAFDGDADRLIMVDGLGREVKGDYILYILAVTSHAKGVVGTVMSNLGFEQALHKQGIALERTAVGDRYVIEGLKKTGYELGGEQSGHILLPKLLQTGDGILAAVQVLLAVQTSRRSLADWCDEVPLVPQAIVNIPLGDKALLSKPAVQAYVTSQMHAFGENGRLLIRPSGTEPLARVMVEAPEAEATAQRIAHELQTIIEN